MWWRSRARSLLPLLRSPLRRPTPIPHQTLTLTPSLPSPIPIQSPWISINPRPFSSIPSLHEPLITDADAGEAASWDLGGGAEIDDPFAVVSEESTDSSLAFVEDKTALEGESLSALWDETVDAEDPTIIFAAEELAPAESLEIDSKQVKKVQTLLLQGKLPKPLDESLDKMELTLSEEFVVRVIEIPQLPVENLVGFVKWAMEYNESVKTSQVIARLVGVVSDSANIGYEEAILVWNLAGELGREKGLLTTGILNVVMSMFWKLRKAGECHEVFEKFPVFGCEPDGDTFYFAAQALCKLRMWDSIQSICDRMFESGSLPDVEKTGKIINLFCIEYKHKEAHLVYLKARGKKLNLPRSTLDILIGRLSRSGKNVHKALKLLDDYSGESLKHANKSFSSVVGGLCWIGDLEEAKKLLLKMAESGPPPGSATFNYVITALSKKGDMEDALAVLKLMESRGLRPDVYTYTVIMSGYAKGGLMEEAHKIFREGKKWHSKLAPTSYHSLTRGYCRMEEYDKALECLKEMKEDGLQPNEDEYNKMIQTLCLKAVDWRTAEKLLEEMKDSGLHIKARTRSLVAALKELAEDEVPTEKAKLYHNQFGQQAVGNQSRVQWIYQQMLQENQPHFSRRTR